ncbi:MAG: SEL1-like repeat protein [Myxococcales bacterium]|nr:SEL1-like repeat protein [Myxococcales bacterium]MCB9718084.1 SEL1-like repeat protein [Myxococcales bacterium]
MSEPTVSEPTVSEGGKEDTVVEAARVGAPAAEAARSWHLTGMHALWGTLPALVMVALTMLPSVAARGSAREQVWVAAAISLVLALVLAVRRPLTVEVSVRRQHYMQGLTQLGVYVAWAYAWEPVAAFAPMIAIQLAFAFQMDALVAWWRREPWRVGFGPVPVILSINLFLWFRDEVFGWQLVMVALCYLAKHVIAWRRDGQRRHVFNPSSFGLAVISFGLIALGASDLTYGRAIALTQESAPDFIFALFALGLVVQLQFRVVLVTASAAVSTWLLGAIFLRVTGVYVFATTDIPAAVFLGMLLLVTDPSTSPQGRTAKLLFGAAYGALVLASFPVLEAMGSLGWYDKLLPVPLLNLLVRRFEGWGAALDARRARPPGPSSSARNLVHVASWAAVFGLLVLTHAVGKGHPGRDITFWQRACDEDRWNACTTYFNLLTSECDAGRGPACHNLGVELLERQRRGQAVPPGREPERYLQRACAAGVEPSCMLLRTLAGGATAGMMGPPLPGELPEAAGDPLAGRGRACDEGEAEACGALAAIHERGGPGIAPDPARALELYRKACTLGSASACSSAAAMEMRKGEGADREAARTAFERACELGDGTGCTNLAGMYLMGDGVPVDQAKAAELNDRACGLQLGIACARLADAYTKGMGVEPDLERARELAAQACTHGFVPACPPGG